MNKLEGITNQINLVMITLLATMFVLNDFHLMSQLFESLEKIRRTFVECLKKTKDMEKVKYKPFTTNHNDVSSDNGNKNKNGASRIYESDSNTDANYNVVFLFTATSPCGVSES